jgi:dUTPase
MTIEEIEEKYRSDIKMVAINPDLKDKKYWKECVVIQILLSKIEELEAKWLHELEDYSCCEARKSRLLGGKDDR